MTAWAVTAALASAVCYALAAALQHNAADQAPGDRHAGVRSLWHLCHQPRWILGIAAMAGGALLHTLALSFGSLRLVQPIGAAGLLFALPIGARLHRAPIRARDWWAAVTVTVGLAVFLRAVRSHGHTPHLSTAGPAALFG